MNMKQMEQFASTEDISEKVLCSGWQPEAPDTETSSQGH